MYTHALYAEDSSPLRELPLGILSRDWTSKSGRIWDVQSKDLVFIGINKDVEPGQEWIKFRGRWGMDDSSFGSSPNSPYHKETWLGKES
jgi:hypothetical protein